MTGSLREKKGYFYIVFSYKDNLGKHKQKWMSTGLKVKGNKRRAEKMLLDETIKLEQGIQEKPEVVKIIDMVELINQWLEVKKISVRANTYKSYEDTANMHVIPYFKKLSLPITELTPSHVQKYYTKKSKDGLTPGTLTRHRTIIRDSFNYAIQTLGVLQSNPADRVTLPKGKKRIPNFYKVDELEVLFKKIRGESIESAVKLAVFFGLRRSEVLGLRWEAVDWKRKVVQISHTVVRVGTDSLYDDSVKENASFRTIPIFPEAESYLKRLYNHQQEMLRLGSKDSGYICQWDDGQPLNPDYVTSRFGKLLDNLNLKHIRFHDLRHSTASLLINNGFTLKQVQEYLGHAKAESTEIYAHLLFESKLDMADKLNNALSFTG